jgi:hypothetical protein
VCAVAVAIGFHLTSRSRTQAGAAEISTADASQDQPRHVGPLAPVLFGKESDEAVCLRRMLQSPLPGPRNLPYCCHLVRLFGRGPAPGPHFTSGQELFAALTEAGASERYFGETAFFPTRTGIRYRPLYAASAMGAENHRDICLATFAEAGLPLSTDFSSSSETYHLRDLLRDSVQNFHLRQQELAWTAVAYALYRSPGPNWTNRFGETFNWDEMTTAVVSAPFGRSSCGGTHLLYAMTMIRRVEGMGRPLAPALRARLDERLKAAISSACARQAADGHWGADWWANVADEPADSAPMVIDSNFTGLLFTGHLLECLTYAPSEFQPPELVYRRAAHWLCRALADNGLPDNEAFCPRTHAMCALRNLVDFRTD